MEVNKVFEGNSSLRCMQRRYSALQFKCMILGLITLILPMNSMLNLAFAEDTTINFDAEVLTGDTLAVFIWPPVDNLSVDCRPLRSGDFRILVSSREVRYGGSQEISLIYIQPRSGGIYNIQILFNSNSGWNGTLGVYTSESEFYRRIGSVSVTSQGYFITLHTINILPRDNQTSGYRININLKAYNIASSNIFFINFPTPINMALFVLVSVAVGYINAFFILDSFFKSKTEGVSKIRWALVALLVLASIYVLYQVYGLVSGGEM